MTTAQQLGLVGNSVRVQALPTASAETFGQGNRYYTLIGQQEGYITGHTYHTVVANDVYSWEDVAQAGPQGEDGLPALVFNDTWGYINVGLFNAAIETFNRTPIVGEKVVIFSTENQYALATIESVSETTVGVRFSSPIIYTKGATGPQGPAGTTVYNNLSDIPVINQDLSASGFTPVANSYYRHTGATTDTFTQGIIYLYDTAYHKLGESGGGGGGTTLNKYTYSVDITNLTVSKLERILKILTTAKGNVTIGNPLNTYHLYTPQKVVYTDDSYSLTMTNEWIYTTDKILYRNVYDVTTSNVTDKTARLTRSLYQYSIKNDGSTTFTDNSSQNYSSVVGIVYYNDTEIT